MWKMQNFLNWIAGNHGITDFYSRNQHFYNAVKSCPYIAEKLKSVFTLVIEYSGELGLTRVLLNISIAEFRETIGWSIGRKDDACRKKEKNSLDM